MAETRTCSLFQLTDSIKEPKVHAHVYRILQLGLYLEPFAIFETSSIEADQVRGTIRTTLLWDVTQFR
jgi:hypothetical protein